MNILNILCSVSTLCTNYTVYIKYIIHLTFIINACCQKIKTSDLKKVHIHSVVLMWLIENWWITNGIILIELYMKNRMYRIVPNNVWIISLQSVYFSINPVFKKLCKHLMFYPEQKLKELKINKKVTPVK